MEFGIFQDGGLLEGQFYTEQAAKAAITERYAAEEGLSVETVCPDHEEQANSTCEECNAEED